MRGGGRSGPHTSRQTGRRRRSSSAWACGALPARVLFFTADGFRRGSRVAVWVGGEPRRQRPSRTPCGCRAVGLSGVVARGPVASRWPRGRASPSGIRAAQRRPPRLPLPDCSEASAFFSARSLKAVLQGGRSSEDGPGRTVQGGRGALPPPRRPVSLRSRRARAGTPSATPARLAVALSPLRAAPGCLLCAPVCLA